MAALRAANLSGGTGAEGGRRKVEIGVCAGVSVVGCRNMVGVSAAGAMATGGEGGEKGAMKRGVSGDEGDVSSGDGEWE